MNRNQALREAERESETPPPSSSTLRTAAILTGVVFVSLFAVGVVPRVLREH